MDSDDYSTDEWNKRKRKEDDQDIPFTKSKKTIRTPSKETKEDNRIDKILAMMIEMRTDMKEIKAQNEKFNEELKTLKAENRSLKEDKEKMKEEIKEMKKEMTKTKIRIEQLEKEKKENNIIISGMDIDAYDDKSTNKLMEEFMKQSMNIEIDIKKASKIRQKKYLVELKNPADKEKVMKNKSKLRKIKDKIYIDEDLTMGEREKRKQINKRAQEEKAKGQVVKVGYNKIIIDGKEWRWDRQEETLVEAKPKN